MSGRARFRTGGLLVFLLVVAAVAPAQGLDPAAYPDSLRAIEARRTALRARYDAARAPEERQALIAAAHREITRSVLESILPFWHVRPQPWPARHGICPCGRLN